jgi:hypothetical protein
VTERTAQEDLAASIARLKALLKHLQRAQQAPDPYDFLAVNPAPGQRPKVANRGRARPGQRS